MIVIHLISQSQIPYGRGDIMCFLWYITWPSKVKNQYGNVKEISKIPNVLFAAWQRYITDGIQVRIYN